MNYPQSIWSSEPMSTGIAALVCYAAVFNDVIGVEEMAARLGVAGKSEFYEALEELRCQGKIIVKDGFAGLPNSEEKIAIKPSKIEFTKKLIESRMKDLQKLCRNPLVKFVGISGSLAAANPTRDRNGRLDLDVFLITRKNCFWIYNIFRGLRRLLPKSKFEPELCINYILDELHLTVPNRNFYTATEIRNLMPIGRLETYKEFLKANSWAGCYYPGMVGTAAYCHREGGTNLIDKIFYSIYIGMRCIKWRSFKPLEDVSFRSDRHSGITLSTFRPAQGGYQALVQKKFSALAASWFPELLHRVLIDSLFPDELSVEIRTGELDVAAMAENIGLGDAYSKYG